VATGWHPLEELAGHKPDLIFDNLSDHSRLLAVWG
jgi:phosphoglycolate phosphatase